MNMLLAGSTPNWSAPLATGHPLGLPGAQKQTLPHQRVQPVSQPQGSSASATRSDPVPHQVKTQAEADTDPATHIAPPSIMQIKISQMLVEQAVREMPEEEAQPETNEDIAAELPQTAAPAKPAPVPAAGQQKQTESTTAETEREISEPVEPAQKAARSGYEVASALTNSPRS